MELGLGSGSCEFSSSVRQETSTKPSPRRGGVQEEWRHTRDSVPAPCAPPGWWGRHQVGLNVGQKGSKKGGEGGMDIPLWVLGMGDQQGRRGGVKATNFGREEKLSPIPVQE